MTQTQVINRKPSASIERPRLNYNPVFQEFLRLLAEAGIEAEVIPHEAWMQHFTEVDYRRITNHMPEASIDIEVWEEPIAPVATTWCGCAVLPSHVDRNKVREIWLSIPLEE